LHENSVATLHLVHAETGVVFRSCGGGGAGVDTLTFSPTGRRLASSGERRSLRVWGVDDGQEILVLQGLDSQISALAFSRDGLSLAASTGAGSVNVYSGSMPQWWWIQAATDR
jgi:WD40 repeat protein